MKILLVVATQPEIGPLLQYLQQHWQSIDSTTFMHGVDTISICTTGVGMVATTYAVAKALLADNYDVAIQAGVGGTFDRNTPLGTVVRIAAEQYGDLGAEDHDAYLEMFDIGLIQKDEHPFTAGKLPAPETAYFQHLPVANGITVNTVSGNAPTISARTARYGTPVESMEGAAFHYVCLQEHVPFVQIRGISNYVEPRNRAAWNMKGAIINLNNTLIDLLKTAE